MPQSIRTEINNFFATLFPKGSTFGDLNGTAPGGQPNFGLGVGNRGYGPENRGSRGSDVAQVGTVVLGTAQAGFNVYAQLILQGLMTIDDVPEYLREYVQPRIDNPPPSVVKAVEDYKADPSNGTVLADPETVEEEYNATTVDQPEQTQSDYDIYRNGGGTDNFFDWFQKNLSGGYLQPGQTKTPPPAATVTPPVTPAPETVYPDETGGGPVTPPVTPPVDPGAPLPDETGGGPSTPPADAATATPTFGDNTGAIEVKDQQGNVVYNGPVNQMPQEVYSQVNPNFDWSKVGVASGTGTGGPPVYAGTGTGTGATPTSGGGIPDWMKVAFPFLVDLGLGYKASSDAADTAKDAADAIREAEAQRQELLTTTLYGGPEGAPGSTDEGAYPGVYPTLKPFMNTESKANDMYSYQLGLGDDPRPGGGSANPFYDLPMVQDMQERQTGEIAQYAANRGIGRSAPTMRDIGKASGSLYYDTYQQYMTQLSSAANPVTTTNMGNLATGHAASVGRGNIEATRYENDANVAAQSAKNAFLGDVAGSATDYWKTLRI